ncbi:hypothetical protein C2S52_006484 [Perilla frutescens var. hirtella]|nr:hypothetical protein C2S52_006484 [Perilla frutescens var. hirtella]
MYNEVADLVRLKSLKVDPRPAPPKWVVPVTWVPPPQGWIKINTDGSAVATPGRMVIGGVFRGSDGLVRCCFHTDDEVGFAFIEELLAVIFALEQAQHMTLKFIWLEADSVYVVSLLSTRSMQDF